MALSDDIKARLDIVDVVSQYVPDLKHSGRNWVARCPFHQERTPSFVVFPERQSWRCFGACATGGDLFAFVMRVESMDFAGTLKLMAQRAGVALTQRRRSSATEQSPLLTVNEQASRYFQEALAAERGATARAYLERRGVGGDAVARFGLGYSPSTGDELLRHLESKGFSRELLTAAGLATSAEGGPVRDIFRGRLVFPIRDASGKLVGFGGRSLDESGPKYLNTPQTAVFDKGRLLYALDLAKEGIDREGEVVVVEGYMDVIAAHEHGFTHVVASMGTALTEHQVALLMERARSFVLALDPDQAGQEATLRSLESSWHVFERQETVGRQGSRGEMYRRPAQLGGLRVALLPPGQDPDALIRQDLGRWRETIAGAVPLLDYLFDSVAGRADLSSSQEKAQAADRLFPLIAAIENPYEQDRHFQRLAGLLGVSPATLKASVGRPRRGLRRTQARAPAAAAPFRDAEQDPLDEHTLALAVHYSELVERVAELPLEHLRRHENRAVLSAIQQAGTIEGAYPLLDGHLADHLDALAARELPPADRIQRAADLEACLRRLEERYLRDLKTQEEVALTQASNDTVQDTEFLDAIHQQMTATNQRLKELFASAAGRPSTQ